MKFTDSMLLEVPSSSTILLLQVKNLSKKKSFFGRSVTKMRTLGYVYIKMKDILQEENQRIHDFFTVQRGVPATLFCNAALMSPYMNYITLLQLGSQNEKHEFGNSSNHFRKIQNEDAEEVFTFGRVKYSKGKGLLKRSGCSDRNISDMKACLEGMNFTWFEQQPQDQSLDVILIKLNNRKLEIKELVALIIRYVDEQGKTCFQIVYRKFDLTGWDSDTAGGVAADGSPLQVRLLLSAANLILIL